MRSVYPVAFEPIVVSRVTSARRVEEPGGCQIGPALPPNLATHLLAGVARLGPLSISNLATRLVLEETV